MEYDNDIARIVSELMAEVEKSDKEKEAMKEPKYKVGDLVSVEKWDASERTLLRHGMNIRPPFIIGSPARIVSVKVGDHICESEVLCTVGGQLNNCELDEGWLLPWEGGLN